MATDVCVHPIFLSQHLPIMLKLPQFIALLAFALGVSKLSATTSYLSVEGVFSGTPTAYKWVVNYTGSTLLTGQDLLNAVFGVPNNGAPLLANQDYMAGTTTNGVLYHNYSFGLAVTQFFVAGKAGPNGFVDTGYWSYFANGGGGDFYNSPSGIYPNDGTNWNYASTGGTGRTLADQTGTGASAFDAWLFGDGSNTPSLNPTATSFAGATQIHVSSAPEPGRFLLAMFSCTMVTLRRKR